jgi:hypothetical protein
VRKPNAPSRPAEPASALEKCALGVRETYYPGTNLVLSDRTKEMKAD